MNAPRKTFVVQLYVDEAEGAQPGLRGRVEELDSGSSAQFDSAAMLIEFLEQALRSVRAGGGIR